MKWSKEELEIAIGLIKSGSNYQQIGIKLNRTTKSIKVKLNKLKIYAQKLNNNINYTCQKCGKSFNGFIHENRKFCSQSCSTSYNNKLRIKKEKHNERKRNEYHNRKEKYCLNCGEKTTRKYCSNKCFQEYIWKEKINKIENGDISFSVKTYKKYLIYKYGEKCMECGWNKTNKFSNTIPIELEHIDGNSLNNNLNNLKLLCPNCHSLTSTYKALNVGNGRHIRRERYKNGKSY